MRKYTLGIVLSLAVGLSAGCASSIGPNGISLTTHPNKNAAGISMLKGEDGKWAWKSSLNAKLFGDETISVVRSWVDGAMGFPILSTAGDLLTGWLETITPKNAEGG